MNKFWKIVFVLLVLLGAPRGAEAATLGMNPPSATFEVGDRVILQVQVESGVPINAVSAIVSFPPIFSIESISKSDSILNFWVSEPSFSKNAGTVSLEGVTLGGFSGKIGTVLTVRAKVVKDGSGSIAFKSGQILANDGEGTDIISGFRTFSYEVKPKTGVSPPVEKTEELEIQPERPQEPATLTAPELIVSQSFGREAVIGTSRYPQSQTLVTFQSADGTKIFLQGRTDDRGGFLVSVPSALKRGTYSATALVITQEQLYTAPSNRVTVIVGSPFSDLSPESRLVAIILLLVILYLGAVLLVYILKVRRVRARIREESREVQGTVRKSFKLLNQDIADVASTREIKKDLKNSEETILEEIKEVGDT
ncbi:MAG: cohesin domain-containing protein [Patescibacteria group bacterium]